VIVRAAGLAGEDDRIVVVAMAETAADDEVRAAGKLRRRLRSRLGRSLLIGRGEKRAADGGDYSGAEDESTARRAPFLARRRTYRS
jgi:hypothetical protein